VCRQGSCVAWHARMYEFTHSVTVFHGFARVLLYTYFRYVLWHAVGVPAEQNEHHLMT